MSIFVSCFLAQKDPGYTYLLLPYVYFENALAIQYNYVGVGADPLAPLYRYWLGCALYLYENMVVDMHHTHSTKWTL